METPKVNYRPDIAMFNASQIINKTIVQGCKSQDEDCVNNIVYPCMEECPGKKQVINLNKKIPLIKINI